MQLISEILEDVLELKIVSKTADSFNNGFYYCETVTNQYDNGWHLSSQENSIEIKNKNEKVLQENYSTTKFKTDDQGYVVESTSNTSYDGINEIQSDHKDFRLQYDDSGRLVSKYGDTSRTLPDNTVISMTMQVDIKYDEQGNYKMLTCDFIPKEYNGKIRQIKDVFTKTVYLFEYDESNQLQAVDMMTFYHDYFDRGSLISRYEIQYSDDGSMIECIHQEGTEEYQDEVFQFYSDGSIVVTKNEYNEGVVIGKTVLTFMRPYYNEIKGIA